MIIQHNIMSLNAHRQMSGNTNMVSKNLEKLSSGYKINRAGDDAAGLAISEKMRAQITGLTRAQSNAQDGISLVQTAEGALTEVHSMLNRMVDLATQSSNGTMQGEDRMKIQDEITSLSDEIQRISQSTNFNGIKLLDGSLGTGAKAPTVKASVGGADVDATVNPATKAALDSGAIAYVQAGNITATIAYTDATGATKTKNVTFAAATDTDTTIAAFKDAIDADADLSGLFDVTADADSITLTAKDAGSGAAFATGISFAAQTEATLVPVTNGVAGSDSETTISLTGWAAGDSITVGGKAYTFADAGDFDALKAAIEADTDVTVGGDIDGLTFTPKAGAGLTLQIGDTAEAFNKVTVSVSDMGIAGLGIDGINVGEQGVASEAIANIKTAIETVSINRSALGALQNRLEHTINNLGVTTENMTAAESRIRDVDMAKEMATFTKNNVLTQAAQAMLAQANQQPQQVLQLLR